MSQAVEMVRDLNFHPVDEHRTPSVLTREQLHAYNRDGVVPRIRLFTGAQVQRNRETFEHLLQAYQARGMDSYQANSCQSTCGSVYDLATHPAVVGVVGDILGDAFACWSTHFFCKLPGDPKRVSWHQDAPYWPFSAARTVTVWLAIDDVDAGNGAMQVVPGSHRHGALPMRASTPEENNVLWLTVDEIERWGAPLSLELLAGEASLHSDMLLHGSLPNTSARRRCGLALRYCTLDVRSDHQWNERSILIRGEDPSGHWGWVRSRPPTDDPFTQGTAIGSN